MTLKTTKRKKRKTPTATSQKHPRQRAARQRRRPPARRRPRTPRAQTHRRTPAAIAAVVVGPRGRLPKRNMAQRARGRRKLRQTARSSARSAIGSGREQSRPTSSSTSGQRRAAVGKASTLPGSVIMRCAGRAKHSTAPRSRSATPLCSVTRPLRPHTVYALSLR